MVPQTGSETAVPQQARRTLLLELSVPPPEETSEFQAWYDREHLPLHLAKPQVKVARRYQDIANADEWLACYYLEEPDSDGVHFVTSGELPGMGRDIVARLVRFEQRLYERIEVPDVAHEEEVDDAAVLMAVWWTPKPETVDNFNAWYDEEHIPMLMAVPGWKAIQRYRQVEGTGPAFLALHYLDSLAALAEPSHKEAGKTKWRAISAQNRIQHERRIFRPYRTPSQS